MQPEQSNPVASWNRTHSLIFIAVLMSAAWIMSMNFADPDLWGHVQYGQEILRDGSLPRESTWTFTAKGHSWINHENIAELAMASAVNQFGPLGLTIGKYAMSLLIIGGLMTMAIRSGVRLSVVSFVAILTALSMEFHWHYRPQIFGYVCFAIMVLHLQWCFSAACGATWKSYLTGTSPFPRRLYSLFALAPLHAIWANTHGSFAAGVCIASAYLGLRAIELLLSTQMPMKQRLNSSVFMGVAIVAGLLATLVTPYGYELHLWLWQALHEPRPEIGDWAAIALFDGSRESLCLWLLVGTAGIAVAKQKQRDWIPVIISMLIAWQAASHIRHLPLLAMAWAAWFAFPIHQFINEFIAGMQLTAQQADSTVLESATNSGSSKLSSGWLLNTSLVVWIVAMGVFTWPRVSAIEVSREKYPVDALAFMQANNLEGRTVVTFNWAQYAIGFFSHEEMASTVAIDGRFRTCYPQNVIDIYFDFFFGKDYPGPRNRSPESGPIDPSLALEHEAPQFVLISKKQHSTGETMRMHTDDWECIYEDHLAEVWASREQASESLAKVTSVKMSSQPSPPAHWPAFATPAIKAPQLQTADQQLSSKSR